MYSFFLYQNKAKIGAGDMMGALATYESVSNGGGGHFMGHTSPFCKMHC